MTSLSTINEGFYCEKDVQDLGVKIKKIDACMGKGQITASSFFNGQRRRESGGGVGQLCCLKLRLDDSAPSICHCCLNKDC